MAQRSMVVRTCSFFLLANTCVCIGVLAASGEATSGQERGDQELVVSLGKTNAVSGETALLSLVVFGRGVKEIISEIAFPMAVLSFEDTQRVSSAELDIHAEVLPHRIGQELAILRVEVASQGELPEGPLVKLKFKVSPGASGGLYELKHTAQATILGGEKVEAATKDGQIDVSEIAVFSCFFYMH